MEPKEAAEELLSGLDWDNHHFWTKSQLLEKANDPNTDSKLRGAIKCLVIDHPEEFAKMDTNNTGGRDDKLSVGNVKTYIKDPKIQGEYSSKNEFNYGLQNDTALIDYLNKMDFSHWNKQNTVYNSSLWTRGDVLWLLNSGQVKNEKDKAAFRLLLEKPEIASYVNELAYNGTWTK
ncbi:hypothetical protein [Actimicrobium sp. CCI2.3]|uniref:hypothetical protein n=1 Tax=Actimicrobium sp. CCI2.3 TaxID=3048616 RepID=UPI002AB33978|nr:hypothetical protein [Actimicrobium sp. CCI2.3]MDY7573709.1 hypothetical protein [Actimicrobium sp. CCI2.3]MEB0021019.1 hypothetical protein [Actimicrobium sp. CCI2.3]